MQRCMKIFLPLCVLFMAFSACSLNNEVNCTMEFRTIGIQIDSLKPDNHYTLRLTTGDTLRHDTLYGFSNGYYVVLDDQAVRWLQGTAENFRFEGWMNDSLILSEPFRIGADRCHIEKLSGKNTWP